MTGVDFTSLRVLVVDDEPFSQNLVTHVLEMLGISTIVAAENGLKALDAMRTAADEFNLLISDIEMPEMGGFELARKVRYGIVPRYKDIPILMLTGHGTQENVMKGRLHRIQGFVVKPPSIESMRRYIQRALAPKE